MGVLGKVLIVLNILAAGAYSYLALQSRKVRQEAAFAVFRHEVAVAGLPPVPGKTYANDAEVSLDFQYADSAPVSFRAEDPKSPGVRTAQVPTEAGGPVSRVVPVMPKKDFEKLFAGATGGEELGGGTVASQLEEVRRARKKVEEVLESDVLAAGDAKLKKVYAYLIDQARTYEERAGLAAKFQTPNGLEQLRDDLFARFDRAAELLEAGAGKGGKHSFAQARAEAAHLLTYLSADPEWRTRVLVVVGQRAYIDALKGQAQNLDAMATRVATLIIDDQSKFEPRYQELTQKALFLALEVRKVAADLAAAKNVSAQHTQTLQSAQAENQALKEELVVARQATKERLAEQARMEQRLFALQREIGDALDQIIDLESEVRKREVGR